VLRREVPVDERGQRILGVVGELVDEPVGIGKRLVGGLRDQVVTRSEVLVEAAVRQPGRLHDLGHGRPVQALFADPLRSGEEAMTTSFHFHQTTTATPEQYVAGLTDFGPGRSELFGNSADGDLEVHSMGRPTPTSPRVRAACGSA
jgi:hypothetical protein